MLQITEQVWVPIAFVRRVSFFGDYAVIKYVDHSEERVDGEDAARLLDSLRRAG